MTFNETATQMRVLMANGLIGAFSVNYKHFENRGCCPDCHCNIIIVIDGKKDAESFSGKTWQRAFHLTKAYLTPEEIEREDQAPINVSQAEGSESTAIAENNNQ